MTNLINTKVMVSGAVILAAAALIIGGTFAFFSDTETSTGNTFTAGALDLKVDSTSHYNGMVCTLGLSNGNGGLKPSTWQPELGTQPPYYPAINSECDGTWTETDLGVTHKFFNLTDVKPGDDGEDTISLHVYNNDAWGRFVISGVTDLDGTCTEPESEVGNAEPECSVPDNTLATTPGELAESITFYAWLDQGLIPGFQNIDANGNPVTPVPDSTEGDNVQQCDNPQEPATCNEPTVILPGTVDENPSLDQTLPDETHNIWIAFGADYDSYCDEESVNANGHNSYGLCQGIADDGRLVGSTTYYFGLAWSVPTTVGNEAQTDSLNADLTFEAVQHRNNSSMTF